LEYLGALQESVVWLQEQRDRWKARAPTIEALLKCHGLEVPQYDFTEKQSHADVLDQLASTGDILAPNTTETQVERSQQSVSMRKLEDENQWLQEQKDHWKMQVLRCEALLKHHGVEYPESHW
jgi:hypothetical protein